MANPKLIPVPFANGGAKTTIPIARASNDPAEMPDYNDGFPPITSTPVTAGGKAPRRPDFNGILNDITANIRHLNSGGFFTFDAAFAANIGGYPKGAVLLSNDGSKKYVSLIDGNTSDFNVSVDATKWAKAAMTERETQDIAWGAGNTFAPWAPLASPALTGMPTAPTAATGTNTTQIATTAFVNAKIAADRPFEATLANIKMNGAQSVGSLNTVARGDHVHPTDTSRVAKAGDTMSGSLKTRYTGDLVGFSADNPTEGKSTFFDGQVAGVPRGGMQIKPAAGGNGEYFTTIAATPEGATNADRRVGGLDVYAGGLYAYAYGWLHDYFLKRSDCVVGLYPSHYGGAQTFKIRNLNLMITTMYVTDLGADTTLNLPEDYTGVVQAFATDAGYGKNNMGAAAVNGTQVRVYAGPATSANILLIGYKNNI